MSITFTSTPGPVIGWKATCCEKGTPLSFEDYPTAEAWLREHRENPTPLGNCDDEDCLIYGATLDAVEAVTRPAVNVANGNASVLLAALGLLGDDLDAEARQDVLCGGSVPAEDFLGRILLALAVAPSDAGVPAHEIPGPGARFVECGRSEGYLQDRLGALRGVADFAITQDTEVVWN